MTRDKRQVISEYIYWRFIMGKKDGKRIDKSKVDAKKARQAAKQNKVLFDVKIMGDYVHYVLRVEF